MILIITFILSFSFIFFRKYSPVLEAKASPEASEGVSNTLFPSILANNTSIIIMY